MKPGWHSAFPGGREWRVDDTGIQSRGPDGGEVHKTYGEPRTMRLYLAVLWDALVEASRAERVPLSLLLMTLATENGPADVDNSRLTYTQVRKESGYESDEATPHRISVGPCHVLISTARAAMGDQRIDRGWLLSPRNNIRVAARYIASQKSETGYDPVLVAAAYNAGSIRRALPGQTWGNRWHLACYTHVGRDGKENSHVDRAASWYGDACRVIEECRGVTGMDIGLLGRVRAA